MVEISIEFQVGEPTDDDFWFLYLFLSQII
jgi:hypothetical protein